MMLFCLEQSIGDTPEGVLERVLEFFILVLFLKIY